VLCVVMTFHTLKNLCKFGNIFKMNLKQKK